MKAVHCAAYGPPEMLQLVEIPAPQPARGQVRIRMRATAVTYSDCFVRGLVIRSPLHLLARLILGLRRPRRRVLGIVVAGEVDQVGAGVTSFRTGDHVFGLDGWGASAWAEYKCMKADGVLASKPENLSWPEAAAIPYGGLLALHFLRAGGIAPGMRVLVYGASGATGSSAVQLAKHFGAHVTGVCSAGNAELVRSLGADHVIDYASQDFTTLGERYQLIFAAVGRRYGPPSEAQCRKALAPTGKYVTVDGWNPKMTRAHMVELRGLAASGALRAVIDRDYRLADIVEANRYVETKRKRGNVVIQIAGEEPAPGLGVGSHEATCQA
jgi:NADPH:quinone reductase-like Zn-dependent oxidoreductase